MKPNGWIGTIRGKPEASASAERTKRVDEIEILSCSLKSRATGNPIHFDADSCPPIEFGGLICFRVALVLPRAYSMLIVGIFRMDLPHGPGTVFLRVEWKFVKAVYVGDSITGRVEITSVRV